jgi:Tfp pilus assembly protein PilO
MFSIKSRKWKIIIRSVTVLTILIFIAEIIPNATELISKYIEYYSVNQKISNTYNNATKITRLHQENSQLKSTLAIFLTNNGKNGRLSDIVKFLNEASKNVGAEIVLIKPGTTYSKNSFEIQSIDLEVRSTYENIYNFIRKIESCQKIITVSYLTISSKKPFSNDLILLAKLEVYTNS